MLRDEAVEVVHDQAVEDGALRAAGAAGGGRFSFNVKGGRCEACGGGGSVMVEMHFLADMYVPCQVCRGRRYNENTLQVFYRGKSIRDVLDMSVAESMDLFQHHPKIAAVLNTLIDVGLEYIALGQSATTFSGGEDQRIKLSRELAKRQTGRTFYLLDEPTTGLHFEDIRKLLAVLNRLVEKGNTDFGGQSAEHIWQPRSPLLLDAPPLTEPG